MPMMPSLRNAGRSRGDGAHGVRVRLVVLQVLVLSLMVTLLGRLWYLQIREGDHYAEAASQNHVRDVITPAVRGQILDDKGRPLVNNRTALVVSVSRTELLRMPDDGEAVLKRLAGVLGMSPEEVEGRTRLCARDVPKPCWNGSPYQPIPVTENATTEQALTIMEHREDFPGVTAELTAVRQYPAPEGVNGAHMVGYLSPVTDDELAKQKAAGKDDLQRADEVGRSGLERTYDQDLRGRSGVEELAVDHLGRVTGTVGETEPVAGNHLVTSIDARIQAITEQQLDEAMKRARTIFDEGNTQKNFIADAGAAVVLDVKTGRVIAMASAPNYDPSVWVGGISQDDYRRLTDEKAGVPLISRATQGQFAPGSIFKVISTSAAAESGYSTKSTYGCPSSISVGGHTFNNLESASYGNISLARALEVSCNTVFYGIGYDMWLKDGGITGKNPLEPMVSMAKDYGLGAPTGIDLPGESGGRITDRASKKRTWEQNKETWCRQGKAGKDYAARIAAENCIDGWQYRAGDAINFAIGQGDTTVTPLQMARVYAAIANGGTLWKPTIGKAVISPDGKLVREIAPEATGRLPISADTLKYLKDALVGVSVNGTAAGVFANWPMDKLPIGAKTGTGSVEGKQSTSWFATFGPANDPQYAVVMMVSQGGTGSRTSGPSVRKIYEALLGVDENGAIDPAKAVLPHPPATLPEVRPDGMVVPAAYEAAPAPLATPVTTAARAIPALSPAGGAMAARAPYPPALHPPAPSGGPAGGVLAAPAALPPERLPHRPGRGT